MVRVRKAMFVVAIAAAGLSAGCQNDKGSSDTSSGKVVSRTQNQDVTPEGVSVQSRTQVKEMPSGEQVRETQMQTPQANIERLA